MSPIFKKPPFPLGGGPNSIDNASDEPNTSAISAGPRGIDNAALESNTDIVGEFVMFYHDLKSGKHRDPDGKARLMEIVTKTIQCADCGSRFALKDSGPIPSDKGLVFICPECKTVIFVMD